MILKYPTVFKRDKPSIILFTAKTVEKYHKTDDDQGKSVREEMYKGLLKYYGLL
jgi:hypothetical protein